MDGIYKYMLSYLFPPNNGVTWENLQNSRPMLHSYIKLISTQKWGCTEIFTDFMEKIEGMHILRKFSYFHPKMGLHGKIYKILGQNVTLLHKITFHP